MFATVLMGVCSFVLLTGSAEQSRLEVTRTVNENFRSSYDILVRPRDSQTATEAATSKVRPNYLSGIYGGISAEQVDQVQGLAGVEVAAPIAMIGQAMITTNYEVDVTDLVREGSGLVRFSTTVTGDRGLSTSPGPEGYVYAGAGVTVDTSIDDTSAFERRRGGSPARVCDVRGAGLTAPFSADARWFPQCWDRERGRYGLGWPERQGRYSIDVPVRFPVTVAAIDPQTEKELTGLDDAVDAGRYFRRQETSKLVGDSFPVNTLPVLNSSRSYIEEDIVVTADALDAETARTLSRGMSREGCPHHGRGRRARTVPGHLVHRAGSDRRLVGRQERALPSRRCGVDPADVPHRRPGGLRHRRRRDAARPSGGAATLGMALGCLLRAEVRSRTVVRGWRRVP